MNRVLILLIALLTLAPAAAAFLSIDFEMPYYIEEPGMQCKDHAIVKHDDLYHVFFIESYPPLEGEWMRQERWLRHMTSPDLIHWTKLDSILPASGIEGDWESDYIWAPKIIDNPDGEGWVLFYTGSNEVVAQQTGGASSTDLMTWTRFAENPVYHPGDWASWSIDEWANCRDPEIFFEDGWYYMLNTALTSDSLGAVSLGRSQDLHNWEDIDPLFINNSLRVMESNQLVLVGGTYHLFYTEMAHAGTRHLHSTSLLDGWNKDDEIVIDSGHAPEVTVLDDETIYSRHNGVSTVDGPIYFYKFDHVNLSSTVPDISDDAGLGEIWTVDFGSAFDNQPTWRDNPRERGEQSSNMEGNGYLATFEDLHEPEDWSMGRIQGGGPTGLMHTETFTIEGDRLAMLVGGIDDIDYCFVGLVEEGSDRLLFLETGEGDPATGENSYAMTPRLWDLSTLVGTEVYLVVADFSHHLYGHISLDSVEEYLREGEDPQAPTLPDPSGPLLADIIEAAGVDPAIGDLLQEVDPDRLEAVVHDLESWGTRFAAAQASPYIAASLRDSLIARGWEAELEPFTFLQDTLGLVTAWNVIARRQGTNPGGLFVVGSHYDSIDEEPGGSWDNPEAPAPGANDNGSGVAALLELARVLGNRTFRHDVEICLFAAEETGLHGSAYHVSQLQAESANVLGYLNVDSIGFDDDTIENWDTVLYYNWWSEYSGFLLDIAGPMTEYTSVLTQGAWAEWSNSDVTPFWQAGMLGISFWEGWDHAPYYNSANDTWENCVYIDFFVETSRAVIASFCVNGELNGYMTPVLLSFFDLSWQPGLVSLRWELEPDSAPAQFRLTASRGSESWPIGWTESSPGSFRAEDRNWRLAEGGLVTYRLEGAEDGLWQTLRSESLMLTAIPAATRLLSPWPNPCNPQLTIPFHVEDRGRLQIAIHDVTGRLIARLADETFEAGPQSVEWRGLDSKGQTAASGLYFVRLSGRHVDESRKVVLLR